MSHDPEQLAAAYLDGLAARQHRRYEQHLLRCEPCWAEVSLARRGRELAESVTAPAPAGARDGIRAVLADAAAARVSRPTGPRQRQLARAAAVLVLILVVAGATTIWRPWHRDGRATAAGSTVAAAVAGYRSDQLPGTSVPAQRAPDLSSLGLHLAGASASTIDGVAVTAFAYRSDSGARLHLYRSRHAIPETDGARELAGTEEAWRTDLAGVTVICGPSDHTQLLIGSDARLVERAGTLLAIV